MKKQLALLYVLCIVTIAVSFYAGMVSVDNKHGEMIRKAIAAALFAEKTETKNKE